ncbi:MAG TPA: hypothetical protein VKV04_05730 [Verrucomicrobiae bacterium]|nr:hypothetical protein [Verrucomicrobiae bacterium]
MNINPLAFIFLLAMAFVILRSSRRNAVGAMLAIAAFVPLGQEITLLGLHLYFLRILILVGFCRLLMRRETEGFKLVVVDKFFICWLATGFICDFVRGGSAETFGAVYDAAGVYFLIRIWTRSSEDLLAQLRLLSLVAIVMGICMAWEAIKHQDLFFVFGGVPKVPMERDGRFRAEGPFLQPILAGTFGATLFPLLVGLWRNGGRGKKLALGGIIGSVMITVASASSGPLLTFVAALIGFSLWPLRERMYLFRRSLVVVLIGFTLVMNAPVWYLIAKVSDVVGGGGWHRSWLIQQFLTHISQWWLVGTSYTANWAPGGEVMPNNPNMMDITNHYVAQGIHGGMLGLGFFLAMITAGFKTIGRAVRSETAPSVHRMLLWTFGVSLASHCAAFISVSYFDQIQVFWFWLLAVIAGVPLWARQELAEEPLPAAAEKTDDAHTMGSAVLN